MLEVTQHAGFILNGSHINAPMPRIVRVGTGVPHAHHAVGEQLLLQHMCNHIHNGCCTLAASLLAVLPPVRLIYMQLMHSVNNECCSTYTIVAA